MGSLPPHTFFSYFCIYIFILVNHCWANLSQDTIYLTWQHSPSTTMTIQWISPFQEKQSTVIYRQKNDCHEWLKTTGEFIPFPQASQYLIHTVELKNLEPEMEYIFKVLPYEEEYQFLTAPAQMKKDFRFVVGGDMYHDGIELMAKTCVTAAKTNPIFALIGGDIAYAVNSLKICPQKIERWIEWVTIWHAKMVTPQGNLIPVISAIGNHDLIGQFGQTPAQAAVFSALFPMPGKSIYNVLDFNSYLSIFILDSGHANPINGQQTEWLKTALQVRQHVPHRLAIYHVPAYPSIRKFQNEQSAAIRSSWVPVFEQGGIQMAFEHHDHAYKRTHPLLKNRIHSEGIVYIGDGGWGVETPRTLRSKRSYLAKFAPVRHFIAVTLTPSQQNVKCINDKGYLIDEYIKKLTNLTQMEETNVEMVQIK